MKNRKKPDYFLKSIVIAEGIDQDVKRFRNKRYQNFKDGVVYDPVLEQQYADYVYANGYHFILEANRILNASHKRILRLKDRIMSYLQMGECIWLTLTFSEEVLNNTSLETRRKYVQRQLKEVSDYYLANIDFGKNTEREHYHAVVVGNLHRSDFQDWIDNIGYIWIETIHNNTSDIKLAKYVSKLTNHAIKETTKRQCYIYSRCKL